MANRYQNLLDTTPSGGAAAAVLPGVNRYSDLLNTQPLNRYADLAIPTAPKEGLFKKTVKSFGGAVGAVGNALAVGQRAITGVLEKGLEKVGVLKDTGIKGTGALEGIQKQKSNIELLQRIGEETGKGGVLTGQYTPSTSVFGNFVRELPSTAIGLAGDIFLDPLFFASKLGKVAEGTSAIGKGIKAGATALAEEIPAVQKVGDMLGRAFLTRYGQREAFKTLDLGRKVEESLAIDKVGKLVSEVIEKPPVIQQRIAQVIKGGITSDNEIKILAEPIRQELDRVGESISKLNPKLLSEETFLANKGTYFPRLYTDYEFPTDEAGTINRAFSGRAVSVPKEPFKARILTEAESVAKGTRIEEAGYPATKRLSQLNITETRQKFFKEVAALASEEPKPGYLQLSEDKALGDLAGKFLPAAEYKAIAEIRRIPGAVEQTYNKALSLWKTFKTAYNPSTISRNDLTNFLILNPLGGVGPHRLDIYAKTANEFLSKGPLYQMARNEGLEISTQQAAELTAKASKYYQANKGLVSQFFGKVENFHNAVKNFYGSQDKFFKLANFIKGVTEDGLTPQKALQRANFYLVDYSEVPAAVEWLRKSPVGIPFISFTYGVSKPLAKTLLERPDKLSNYFKILSGIQQMNPQGESPIDRQAELDVTPEWIQKGTTLRLPVKDRYERGQYIDLQYILPFNILESKNISPSSPVLTILSAMLSNRDSFTNKDITIQTDTQAEKVQKWSTYVVRQIVPSLAPFGYSWEKIKALIQKRPDAHGYVRNALQVFSDVLAGVKITPIDPTIEAQKRAYEKQKQLEELRSNLIRIQTDKTLLPDVKIEETKKIQEKISKVFQ